MCSSTEASSFETDVTKEPSKHDGRPVVSICIPVYNAEKTIKDTLLSAIGQTYKDLEIIVVDNASTDGTPAILEEMKQRGVLVYRNQENLGMVGNWNKCLEHATGEYICLLCADDIVERDCIERKVEAMNSADDIVMAFGASEVINENDEVLLRRRLYKHSCVVDGKALAKRSYRSRNLFGEPSNVLFKKASIDLVGNFDANTCYVTDWHMWLKIACTGRVAYVDKVLMRYRVSTSNQTSNIRLSAFLRDDRHMVKSLKSFDLVRFSPLDVVVHRTMYVARLFARSAFMRLKA